MAELIPGDKFESMSEGHFAERATLAELADNLRDDLTIYHGLHWASATRFATRYGEIDFVIVDDTGRIVLIEQKNGLLEESESGLYKRYDGTYRKSVGDQLHRSVDAIRQKFAGQHPAAGGLFINCLLYCPDYRVVRVHASTLDAARIVDSTSKDNLATTIESLFDDAKDRELPNPENVHAFFSPEPGYRARCRRPNRYQRAALHAQGTRT